MTAQMPVWPPGDGEMAARIRAFAWDQTPLGPIAGWGASLRTMVDLVLGSPVATVLLWGPDHIQLYNEHWAAVMDGKHPAALGRSSHQCFPEIADTTAPLYARVQRGEAVVLHDHRLPIARHGAVEDAWWNVHYLPVRDETGVVAGILCTVVETTGRILAERERVAQQAALDESRQRFQALVAAGTYTIYRMSADWRLMYRLDSISLALTTDPIEHWVDKYIPDIDRPRVMVAIDHAIRTKSLFELEHRVWTADGGIGWVLSRAMPMLDGEGRIIEWVGAGSDITERREAAERLRESEERHRLDLERQVRERTAELKASHDLLRATMDSSTDMIQVFEAVRDTSGAIVDFRWVLNNRTAESRYGELRGQSLLQRNANVVEDGMFDALRRVTETGVPEQAEHHHAHEHGDGWFYQSVVRLGDGVATTTKNIGGWKAAQAELLRVQEQLTQARLDASESRLAAIFAHAPVGLSEVTPDGRFLRVNSELCRILGRDRDALLATTIAGVTHPDEIAPSRERLDQAAATGAPATLDKRYLRPDGSIIWASSTVAALFDAQERPDSFLVVTIDLTERRAAEAAVRAGIERQQVLLAELQHRVRNILAVIRSTVRRSHDEDRSTQDYIQHLDGRIAALARTQVLLTRQAGSGIDLEDLIRDELLAQVALPDQFALTGPQVLLAPKAAEILTLAIHELATNATKYGAFAREDGLLDVRWQVEPRDGVDWLVFQWSERGVPVLDPAPRRQGFGTELIEARVPYELRGSGELTLRPGGAMARITFPLVPGDSILQTDGVGE